MIHGRRHHSANTRTAIDFSNSIFLGSSNVSANPSRLNWRGLRSRHRAMTADPGYRTGTMVFLHENHQTDRATAAKDGLMAWSTHTLIEMLLNHYDFRCERIDWTQQGVDTEDWRILEDYRNGERGGWMARPLEDVGPVGAGINSVLDASA
jgi:hypothetical protein